VAGSTCTYGGASGVLGVEGNQSINGIYMLY
jgi:hypothetical protein